MVTPGNAIFRYWFRRGLALLTMTGLLIGSPVVHAEKKDWQGHWKINIKSQYARISIDKVTDKGFDFHYDEGIGIQGHTIHGQAHFKNDSTATIGIEDNKFRQCQLTIRLHREKREQRLELLNCGLNHYTTPTSGYVFVPESTRLFYQTSFSCARATTRSEKAVCDSEMLAAADVLLRKRYLALQKQLIRIDKKRLLRTQKAWLDMRNRQCNQLEGKPLEFCLRQYYGQRLLNLYVLAKYNIWLIGPPNHDNLHVIHKAHKKTAQQSEPELVDNGLGLWLGGVMGRYLTDSGSFALKTTQPDDQRLILSGQYRADPAKGHDPYSAGNQLFLEVGSNKQFFAALFAPNGVDIYLPQNVSPKQLSREMKAWLDAHPGTQKFHRVF